MKETEQSITEIMRHRLTRIIPTVNKVGKESSWLDIAKVSAERCLIYGGGAFFCSYSFFKKPGMHRFVTGSGILLAFTSVCQDLYTPEISVKSKVISPASSEVRRQSNSRIHDQHDDSKLPPSEVSPQPNSRIHNDSKLSTYPYVRLRHSDEEEEYRRSAMGKQK